MRKEAGGRVQLGDANHCYRLECANLVDWDVDKDGSRYTDQAAAPVGDDQFRHCVGREAEGCRWEKS